MDPMALGKKTSRVPEGPSGPAKDPIGTPKPQPLKPAVPVPGESHPKPHPVPLPAHIPPSKDPLANAPKPAPSKPSV